MLRPEGVKTLSRAPAFGSPWESLGLGVCCETLDSLVRLGVFARRLVSAAYEERETTQLDAERDAMAHAAGGEEAAEGIAAFLEKRKPEFDR